MKYLLCAGAVLATGVIAGCSPDTSRPPTPPAEALSSAPTDTSKAMAQQGMANQSITQKVMQTHRLPNGQPIPGYTGKP